MKIMSLLLMSITLFFSSVKETSNQTINATVINLNSEEGVIYFALFTKDNFMQNPVQYKKGIIKNGKCAISFTNVIPGEYAVTCYHDKNNNGKMDFATNGMPLEDYGASNNVMNFGPPQYNDAKFEVTDKDVSLDIKF